MAPKRRGTPLPLRREITRAIFLRRLNRNSPLARRPPFLLMLSRQLTGFRLRNLRWFVPSGRNNWRICLACSRTRPLHRPRFCSVPLHQLLRHFGLGGDRWVSHFIVGFPTVGSFSQAWVYPLSDKHHAPVPVSAIWRTSANRFEGRVRASGFRIAHELWGEAMEKVASGWLGEPIPFSEDGGVPFFSLWTSNAAFRFSGVQDSKLRPCGDLRHNLTNVCAAILTPINLPTRDRLSEIAKSLHHTSRDWSFFKGAIRLHINSFFWIPPHANLTVVALRNPQNGRWMAFVPKVLLLGSISAVLH